MNILENYYERIIKHDFINKFNYSNIKEIPKLKKIVLNFGCNKYKLKDIAPALLYLELISDKVGTFTRSKKGNLFLKIRKGQPVGCRVILTDIKMYSFLWKLSIKIFPFLKNFKGIYLKFKNKQINSISFYINDLTFLKELNTHFYFYHKLPPLNITLVTNAKSKKEFIYLLNSFKIPLLTK